MDGYHSTIETLFSVLSLANMADSDEQQCWQKSIDASSTMFYGDIRASIVKIAGQSIVKHWEYTGEVDCNLASRNKMFSI